MKHYVLFFAWAQDTATNDYFRSLTPIENVGTNEAGNDNFSALWVTAAEPQVTAAYGACSDFDESEIEDLCAPNPYWVARLYNAENGSMAHDMDLFGLEQDPQLFRYAGEE